MITLLSSLSLPDSNNGNVKVKVIKNLKTSVPGGEELIHLTGQVNGLPTKFVIDTACGGFIIHSRYLSELNIPSTDVKESKA